MSLSASHQTKYVTAKLRSSVPTKFASVMAVDTAFSANWFNLISVELNSPSICPEKDIPLTLKLTATVGIATFAGNGKLAMVASPVEVPLDLKYR